MKQLKSVSRKTARRKVVPVSPESLIVGECRDFSGEKIDPRQLLLSLLVPPAVSAFFEELDKEIVDLCGNRYTHEAENRRWGHQPGSIVGNQKVRIDRPRVRDKLQSREVRLKTYEEF